MGIKDEFDMQENDPVYRWRTSDSEEECGNTSRYQLSQVSNKNTSSVEAINQGKE
jgi:hypothetical protein